MLRVDRRANAIQSATVQKAVGFTSHKSTATPGLPFEAADIQNPKLPTRPPTNHIRRRPFFRLAIPAYGLRRPSSNRSCDDSSPIDWLRVLRSTMASASTSGVNAIRRVDGKSVQLALWDTAGQEDYERLRPLAYAKAHILLIGFSVDTPDSLDNVKHKWIPEATERCPGVPIILVGLKKDLRDDPNTIEEMRKKSLKFVTERQGEAVAQEIGARKYLECSSLTGEGVDDVFEAATRAALLTFEKGERGGCCVIL
ncbi:hypothetical protein FHL15_000437 [Xylaria flabelliformis]|uniref:Uncharacterized protein n=1 Tax=Xylaria flabelliformis TaxID=2512241 RepID=A0A553IFX3_9PEZI|nr:hypothetical protein FHL15_000437 [Xylaria flabelliformis]